MNAHLPPLETITDLSAMLSGLAAANCRLPYVDEMKPGSALLVVGCGDSYLGPLAMEYYCARATDHRWHVYEALEFSRFVTDVASDDIVIAVSASGRSPRVLEAARRARAADASVVALTADAASPLARATGTIIALPCPAADHFPTRTTIATMFILAQMAARTAMRAVSWETLQNIPYLIDISLTEAVRNTPTLVNDIVGERDFYFVGAGPSYGTAALGMAKLKEAIGGRAVALQLEEFNHVQDQALSSRDVVCVIAPGPATIDVALRIIELAAQRGATSCVFTTASESRSFRAAHHLFSIPDIDELLSPLLVAPVLQFVIWHLYHATGSGAS